MAGTIIADYIRTDANKLSLNVGNLTFATINAGGMYSNTGVQLIAANGTVATSALSGTISTAQLADSSITRAKMNITGTVLQSVQYVRSANFNSGSSLLATTSATYADVITNSITTTVANSKILVLVNCVGYYGQGSLRAAARVERNGSLITGDPYAWYAPTATMSTYYANVLDAPAAVAGTSLTYTLRGSNQGGGGTMYLGYADSGGGATNSITLLEIAP